MLEDFRPPSTGLHYCKEAFEANAYLDGKRVAEDSMFYHAFCQFIVSVVADKTQLIHFRAKIVNEVLRVSGIGEDLNLSMVETAEPIEAANKVTEVQPDENQQKVQTSMKDLNSVTWCALSLVTDRYFDDTQRLSGCSIEEIEQSKHGWYELISLAFLPSTSDRRLDMKALNAWVEGFLNLHKNK